MSSFRSRPRLRLGPVDGHDEDFDPLLGRTAPDSAASLPSLSSAPARAAAPDGPTASVFDEPDQAGPDGELPPAPAAVPAPPAAPTVSWQPIAAEIPVRRLPSQPPGKGLFVFRNPWRGPGTPADTALPAGAAAALASGPSADGPPVDGPPVDGPPVDAPSVDSPLVDGPAADGPVAGAAPAEAAAPPRWPFGVGTDASAAQASPAQASPAQASSLQPAEPPEAGPLPDVAPPPEQDRQASARPMEPVVGDDGPQPLDLPADAPAPPQADTARPARQTGPGRPAVRSGRPGAARKGTQRRTSRAPSRSTRKAEGLPPLWMLFTASFLAGGSVLITGAALAAPLGGPFQLFSDHLMYVMVLPVVALGLWIAARLVVPALLTALILLVQGVIVVPSLGSGPVGGDTRTIIGWATLAGSQAALEDVLREAGRQEARLLLLGNAPDSLLSAPPAGWIIAARPTPGDGAAITILSRGGWRAANVAGEPAMARSEDGSVTVIGVNPPEAAGDTRGRDAEINRSAARAGVQTTPTLAIGAFGVVPWNGAISQFTSYGNVTRVRCGGLFGATQGLLALDHAFVRGIAVTGCRTTGALTGSGHRPIWIRLGAPEPAATDDAGG